MAGGPIHPRSIVVTKALGRVFPNVYEGPTNTRHEEGIGVEASLSANSVVELRFQLPEAFPTGTLKLKAQQISAVASSQVEPWDVAWNFVAAGASPDAATLTAEGPANISLTSSDQDEYVVTTVDLDHTSQTGHEGEDIVMEVTFETSGWTVSVVTTWFFSLIWE